MHPTPLPPSLNEGRYILGEEIGRGGMAVVMSATDTTLSVERAIKIVFPDERGTDRLRRRLRAEARAMARIHHPNILSVHDIGSHGDLDYVVMDLATNGSLQDRLDREGPLPPAEATELVSEVLGALAVAHSHGIVHRDVKPQNILLDGHGRPLLADFGIALLAHDLRRTQAGTTMGSLSYMPPEQRLDAASVGPTADIYAAGATLYALITGDNPVDLFLASDLSSRWNGVPDPLRPVLFDALSYDPEVRWASAGAMATALLEILESGELDGVVAARRRVFDEPAEIFSRGSAHPTGPGATIAPLPDDVGKLSRQYMAKAEPAGTAETLSPEPNQAPVPAPIPVETSAPGAARWWRVGLVAALLLGMVGVAWLAGDSSRAEQTSTLPASATAKATTTTPAPELAAMDPSVSRTDRNVVAPTPSEPEPIPVPQVPATTAAVASPPPPPPATTPAPTPSGADEAQRGSSANPEEPTPRSGSADPDPPSPQSGSTDPDEPRPQSGSAGPDALNPWGTWTGSLGGVLLTAVVSPDGHGTATTQFGPNQSSVQLQANWSPESRKLTLTDDGSPRATYKLVVSADGRSAQGTVTSATHQRPVVLERQ